MNECLCVHIPQDDLAEFACSPPPPSSPAPRARDYGLFTIISVLAYCKLLTGARRPWDPTGAAFPIFDMYAHSGRRAVKNELRCCTRFAYTRIRLPNIHAHSFAEHTRAFVCRTYTRIRLPNIHAHAFAEHTRACVSKLISQSPSTESPNDRSVNLRRAPAVHDAAGTCMLTRIHVHTHAHSTAFCFFCATTAWADSVGKICVFLYTHARTLSYTPSHKR